MILLFFKFILENLFKYKKTKYKIWARENFKCGTFGLFHKISNWSGCSDQMVKGKEYGRDDQWFKKTFDDKKKLGSGGFGSVFQEKDTK